MTNDQSTDLEKLIQQASQGNADAQFNLGVMYDIGQGVPQDDAEAAKWYRLAADQEYSGRPEEDSEFPGYLISIGLLAALLVSRLFRTRYKPKKKKE